jgi:prepilin-type N-terminal cleavage/methylation domain-containing protein
LKNSIPVDESQGENLVRISKSQGGFSLTELLVTVAILMVGGAVAVMNVAGAVRSSHVETAYQNTLDQLRFARQVAIDKRTVCRVDFTAPGTVSVTQHLPTALRCRRKQSLCRQMSSTQLWQECPLRPRLPRTTLATELSQSISIESPAAAAPQFFSSRMALHWTQRAERMTV